MLGAPFSVVAKPRGARCNLACRYCFYLDKGALYPRGTHRMSGDVLREYVKQVFDSSSDYASFVWQGGEPTLMGLPFFEEVVAVQRQNAAPGVTVQNALQTNGLLLDDAWCSWLSRNDFLVGISLDGPRTVHDTNRLSPTGKPTFDEVAAAVVRLQRHEVNFNILACVSDASVGRGAEIYRFFRDEIGANFLQFIPIVEVDSTGVLTPESITGPAYGEFLCAVFDEWVRHDVGRVFVQIFDAALAAQSGNPPPLCAFARECGDCPALEHTGDVYCCDHYVEPESLLGNILTDKLTDLVASPKQRRFGKAKATKLAAACEDCQWRSSCNGGCPKNRFVRYNGEDNVNVLCEGYRAFFAHINRPMRIMAQALERELAPSMVMTLLAVEAGELPSSALGVDRNDPCPCWSGQKFKKCHA